MINEAFFKTITILYVENDENVRNKFLPILNKLFKKVLIAMDGEEALTQFEQYYDDKHIDIIISETDMPNMCGLELLTRIRNLDKNIPFVFFTENTDVNLLLTSLRQDVTGHFKKPVDFMEVLQKVEEVCIVKKHEDEMYIYQNEVESYLNIVNQVAVVFIFDKDGNINYVNDFLTQLIQCKEEELLGQQYTSIYHHEISKDILSKQWDTLQSGKKWDGKIKYLTKNSEVFYTNSTIIPVYEKDTNTIGKYISVNFLTTKEEQEKREYKKKVLYNLQETKKVYRVAQMKIDELNKNLEKYKGFDKIETFINNKKKTNQEQYQELLNLENRLKSGKVKFEQLTFGVNEKIKKIAVLTASMKDFEHKANKKIKKVSDEIKIREAYINKIKDELEDKAIKIQDLEDVMKHRTEQLTEQRA